MNADERAELRRLIDKRRRERINADAFFNGRAAAPGRDNQVVPTRQLNRLLDEFVNDWKHRHPSNAWNERDTTGNFTSRDDVAGSYAAVTWLTEESGVSTHTIQNILGRKDTRTGKRKPRTTHTELHVADALIAALGCPEAFHDGRLTVRANPQASQVAQAAVQSERAAFARERQAEHRAERKYPGQMSLTGDASWPFTLDNAA